MKLFIFLYLLTIPNPNQNLGSSKAVAGKNQILNGFEYTSSLAFEREEADWIAHKIFHNECSCNVQKLVWWNDGEEFVSCGIGHFIWYPEGKEKRFSQTFPDLIAFMQSKNVKIPEWIDLKQGCPWHSKEEYNAPTAANKKEALRTFLKETLALQFEFISERFEKSIPTLIEELSEEESKIIQEKIRTLSQTKQGRYALLDYLNFKGSGVCSEERYKNEGWGLKQVLLAMESHPEKPVAAFVIAAQNILKKRVENSPHAHEHRWLPGWLARVESYTNPRK